MKRAFVVNGQSGADRDGRRRARFRLDALTAVLAGTIMLAAACSGSSSTDPSSTQPMNLQTLTAKALAYAKCMRSHGITNYPDPVNHGNNIQIGPGPDSGVDMNSAKFKAAQKACTPLLPNGGP